MQVPPANAIIVIKATPRIPLVSVNIAFAAVLDFELEVLVDEEAVALDPAGAVGVNVADGLERQEVSDAATAEEAGGLATAVAFPEKSQD